MPRRILVVDDDRDMCQMLEADLRLREFDVQWFTAPKEAFEAAKQEDFDVVLTDLNMPGMNGIELCERIVSNRPDIPVVVVTAFGSMETAIEAIRVGAFDFVTKPFDMEMLALTLNRAVRHRELQEKVKTLSEVIEKSHQPQELVGESTVMQTLFHQLERIADSETSVLITGESGTGKELVARALHERSRRCAGPFVAINCAALPEPLLESELFGHVKGAFTDARAASKGLILEADQGTLFLDEIGEFPLALQSKLLRVLEERKVRPVGGNKEVPFDCRILTATNRDLEVAVEAGHFREDLFYRINVIQLDVPPLRARGMDILLLAQHYLLQFAKKNNKEVTGISKPVAEKLLAYAWPGNVREMRNVMERAVALTQFDKLTVEDLPKKIRGYRSSQLVIGSDDPTDLVPLEEFERRYIMHVLKSVGGNKSVAARKLGLDRKTLYRRLERYGKIENDNPTQKQTPAH